MKYSILHDLGLTKNEISIFLVLLRAGVSSAGVITEKTGIHRRNVYDCLDRLMEKGIVGYVIISGRKYFNAVDPKYLVTILEEERASIAEKEEKVNSILPSLLSMYTMSKNKEEVSIYRGDQALKLLFDNILKHHQTNYVLGAHIRSEKHKRIVEDFNTKRVKAKICDKIIFDPNDHNRGLSVSRLPYTEVRFYPLEYNSEVSINIYGGRVAMLVFSDDDPLSILIKNENIHNGFMTYFSMLWNISIKASQAKKEAMHI